MLYQNDRLYLFDKTRGDVAVNDFSENKFHTVGKIGQGPSEVVSPVGFTVLPNGNVAILDVGSLCLKIYDESGFVASHNVPVASENRFFIYGDKAYLTLATDTSCYVKVSPAWERGTIDGLDLCGNLLYITEDAEMNLIRNKRHLVKGDEHFYCISQSYPVIEKYELDSGKLIEAFDLSEIDCINDIWKFICKNESSPKSFYVFLRDVYYENGKLYILYADWENGYSVNNILVLDTGAGLKPVCNYSLPGNLYTSFAVNNNLIYAMDYEKNEIQTIRPAVFN